MRRDARGTPVRKVSPVPGASFSWKKFRRRFALAPLALRAYLVFAIVVCAAVLVFIGLSFAWPAVLDTAWAHVVTQQVFNTVLIYGTSFFAVSAIYARNRQALWSTIGMLGLVAFFATAIEIEGLDADLTFASILEAKSWTLVWTAAIPLAWMAALSSRRVRTYCAFSYVPKGGIFSREAAPNAWTVAAGVFSTCVPLVIGVDLLKSGRPILLAATFLIAAAAMATSAVGEWGGSRRLRQAGCVLLVVAGLVALSQFFLLLF